MLVGITFSHRFDEADSVWSQQMLAVLKLHLLCFQQQSVLNIMDTKPETYSHVTLCYANIIPFQYTNVIT